MMNQDQIVDAIRTSTDETFSMMLGLSVELGTPRSEVAAPGPSDGIIAVVGLAGAWIGTASLACDVKMACRIAGAMLGSEFSEINDEVLDAVSEIANMIVGNFKTVAENHLGVLGLSIPTVVYGLSFCARSGGKEKWTVIPFKCEGLDLEIKVCLTPNRGLARVMSHAVDVALVEK